jgi:peptidyl-dipeptidase Dcp
MELGALKPALEAGMAAHLAEIEAIAASSEPATFENTILALEGAGRAFDRVETYWSIWSGNLSSPEFRAIQAEMAPRLAQYRSEVTQNPKLFARIRAVYDGLPKAALGPAERRLVELVYDDYARNGATLEGAAKERYAAIQKRLAELHTKFANNVLADEEGYTLFLEKGHLAGLPESFVAAAAASATELGQAGRYAIVNTRSSMDPFLTYAADRGLREKVWRNYYSRGDNGDERDNNALIAEILALRDERVALLGYDNYAQWRLADRMAKTPERALELMEAVWPAAVARVAQEVAEMQAVADAEGAGIRIAPWDYRYYAEKVRKARYDLDSDEVKQYLQLDKLREAMFFVAGELFGFRFTPVPAGSVPVYHPDVRVFEVADAASGEHVGIWYFDPFARAGKRSGAWASTYRVHETFDGLRTVLVSNNSNFIEGAAGEPVLISWDDAGPTSTSSATRCTRCRPTSPTRRSTAACATTPSSSRSCSSAGWSPTRSPTVSSSTIGPARRSPTRSSPRSRRRRRSTRGSRPPNTWPRRSSTCAITRPIPPASTPTPSRGRSSPSSACRRRSSCAIARRTSAMSSRARATRRATTATCGRTC